MLLWLSLLFKRRRSSPHNVESAGRLTCAFYNLQLFQYFNHLKNKVGLGACLPVAYRHYEKKQKVAA